MDELMKLIPEAFRSLLPSLAQAGIPWHDDESYDPWDHIAQIIYHEYVIEPLRHSTGDFELTVPRYSVPESLGSMSYMAVIVEAGGNFVFDAFNPDDDLFNRAWFNELDAAGNRLGRRHDLRVADLTFEFRHRQPDGSLRSIQRFVLQE